MKRFIFTALGLAAVLTAVYTFVWPEDDKLPKEEYIPEKWDDPVRGQDAPLLVDTHCDTLTKIIDEVDWLPAVDIGKNTSFHIDIPKLKRGGVNVQYFAAFTSGYYTDGGPDYTKANSRLLSLVNAMYWTLDKNSEQMGLAKTVEDIENLASKGKISAVLSIEGAYSLDEECGIELLRQYYDLGIRAVGLTWNHSNALGEGVNEAFMDGSPSEGGLTQLGERIVAEANRLGIIVDVSHMNQATFWDVLETSTKPVIASHSGAYNLRNHARNLTDGQIKAIAQGGGVINVVFYPGFVVEPSSTATVETVVDHIEYIAELVGIEHVGLGSDFDGAAMPDDLKDASMVGEMAKELAKRKFTREDIYKIMGQNAVRVMEEVWEKKEAKNPRQDMVSIEPMLDMGQSVSGKEPGFQATVKARGDRPVDVSSLRFIIDGKAYIPEYQESTGLVFLQLDKPLKESFHVVTFEAAAEEGQPVRETIVFHIE